MHILPAILAVGTLVTYTMAVPTPPHKRWYFGSPAISTDGTDYPPLMTAPSSQEKARSAPAAPQKRWYFGSPAISTDGTDYPPLVAAASNEEKVRSTPTAPRKSYYFGGLCC